MNRIGASAAIALAVGALTMCEDPQSSEALARAYVDAVNRGDLSSLDTLLVDDCEWHAGAARPLVGKEEVVAGHRREVDLNTRLALTLVEARRDTVRLQLMESSDRLRDMGIEEASRPSYLIVRNGRIRRIERLAPTAWGESP
jgi:ketosteroid isomerase-like protein